jgi:hypothetical protein
MCRWKKPFSRNELENQKQAAPGAVEKLFANRKSDLKCWELIRTGLYPPIHDRGVPPEIWLSDYVRTYVERDVRALANIGDLETFERFLKLCAGRVGQLTNYSALAADCGIAVDTARRWISILKTSFIVFLLPPHHRNFNKRVTKTPKLYFHDTGLACLLIGIRSTEQVFAHPLRGALFENYVIAEVGKAYFNHRRIPPIHFWRDQTGNEIDLLIEEGNALCPVEIKSGSTVAADMFAGLKRWMELAKEAARSPILVYGGGDSYTRQEVAVRPWYAV